MLISMNDKFFEELKKPFYIGKSVRVFLSYSHVDGFLAEQLKHSLERYGLEVFMAHEDIEPSKIWQDEIIRSLKACDVFIPILTHNFSQSKWTDQESGIAFAEGKVIIPIKVEIDPYGFLHKFQALKYSENRIGIGLKIIEAIRIKIELTESVKDSAIRAFANSSTFDEANNIAKILGTFESFNINQINELARLYLRNNQIRGGGIASKFVLDIVDKNSKIVLSDYKNAIQPYITGEKSWVN